MMMNFRVSHLIQATAFAIALGSVPVAAQSEDDRVCSAASLKGTYGLHASGTRPVAGSNQSETHSTLARRSYDGKGGLKSWPIVSQGQVSGVAEGTGTVQTGTYEVNPDCTGQMTLTLATPGGPIQLSARFVVAKAGPGNHRSARHAGQHRCRAAQAAVTSTGGGLPSRRRRPGAAIGWVGTARNGTYGLLGEGPWVPAVHDLVNAAQFVYLKRL